MRIPDIQWAVDFRPGIRACAGLIGGLLALLLAGCGGGSSSTSTTVPTSITVTPASASAVAGGTATFTAVAVDSNGGQVTSVTFTWASSAPNVATINNTGLATALAAGTAQITASTPGVNGATVVSKPATLTVTPPVASITVSPPSATIPVNGTQQFTATAFDASGNPLPGVSIAWFCSNAAVATINSSGLATGVAPGIGVIIQATTGGVNSPPAMLTVTP